MLSRSCGQFRLLCGVATLVMCLTSAFADVAYTVKAGDTVSELAARFSTPVDEIVALNNLKDPDVIYVGQQLRLPERAAPLLQAEKTAENEHKTASPDPPTADPAATTRALSGRALLEERARLLATQRGEQIVATARTFAGAPYRRGGLSSRGIDCSGLVVRAMAAQGIDVPHHAAALYCMGVRVTYEQLQSGDLVFFNTSGAGVSHVGIWVGDNKFIHASSGGRGVVVDRMEGYYARRLVGARRLQQ